jgi:2-amino-4-hydroxy-6-hydroxymethyldihydropteridine diphosphokinase
MGRVFVGIGSNIAPELHVPRALARLDEAVGVVAVSTFYVTPPLGRPADPPFMNGVVEVRDTLAAAPLKVLLGRIELDEGRRRGSDRFAPRPIDLDLLLHDDLVSTVPPLPHPDVTTRRFVAVALLELEPSLTLPGSGVRLSAIVEALPPWSMEPAVRLTRSLRERFTNGRRPS